MNRDAPAPLVTGLIGAAAAVVCWAAWPEAAGIVAALVVLRLASAGAETVSRTWASRGEIRVDLADRTTRSSAA